MKLCSNCYQPLPVDIKERKRLAKIANAKRSIAKAKRNGTRLGRPPECDRDSMLKLRQEGFSLRQIAEETGSSYSTVQRVLK